MDSERAKTPDPNYNNLPTIRISKEIKPHSSTPSSNWHRDPNKGFGSGLLGKPAGRGILQGGYFLQSSTVELIDTLRALGVSAQTISTASKQATRFGQPIEFWLLHGGLLTQSLFARAVAKAARIPFADRLDLNINVDRIRRSLSEGSVIDRYALLEERGYTVTAVPSTLSELKRMTQMQGRSRLPASITTRQVLHQAILDQSADHFADHAINSVEGRFPGSAAADGLYPWQKAALFLVVTFVLLTALSQNDFFGYALFAGVSIFFALQTLLRMATISLSVLSSKGRIWGREPACTKLERESQRFREARIGERYDLENWPVYTVLIPLHDEAHMLPEIVSAMSALDYPKDRLDLKIMLEESDTATVDAARRMRLPNFITVLEVPDLGPRTKPKALNIGLTFARGQFVVVYDAEDRPDPQQLKKAVKTFRESSDDVGVLQARLVFYNWSENWLTRQFAIEYAVHFSFVLPALRKLGLPIPLGGTSNHFRTSTLRAVGAWDAHNVTEDADLGIRLHRKGWYCGMLDSETCEEAACKPATWLRQRTRWVKGWLQTWAVHMRNPVNFVKESGWWSFLGVQIMIGGMILSPLAHMIFAVYVAYLMVDMTLGARDPIDFFANWKSNGSNSSIGLLAIFNLTLGYGVSLLLGWIAAKRKEWSHMALALASMPLYWLCFSLAALRAFWKLITAPYEWEKTPHGLSGVVQPK